MSKRPAEDISPSIENDINDDSGFNTNNNNNDNINNNTTTPTTTTTTTSPTPPRKHYIEQTIMGPVCTHPKCNTKLGTNFTVSDDTLRRHWKNNKCYNGDVIPNATQLVRKLEQQLVSMIERNQRNPPSGQQLVDRYFPSNNTITTSGGYCVRCGYCNIPSLVKQHINSPKTKCNMLHFKHGIILKENKYECKMPIVSDFYSSKCGDL